MQWMVRLLLSIQDIQSSERHTTALIQHQIEALASQKRHGSYQSHLYTPHSYQYQWSSDPDPPRSGKGSHTKPWSVNANISGVLPAWIVVDEFHLLKAMAKGAGPWQSIMDMRKCAEDFPSLIAMSGTPVSIGPADIKGPLMCLTNDRATLFPPNRSSYHTFSLHQARIRCRSSRVAAEIWGEILRENDLGLWHDTGMPNAALSKLFKTTWVRNQTPGLVCIESQSPSPGTMGHWTSTSVSTQ